LARSAGADARVATGFVADPERVEGSIVTFSSADAAIWPEVRSGDEWLAFDPAPETPLADEQTPPAEPTVQSPAAPQPPIAPPPDDIDEPLDEEEQDDSTVEDGVTTVVTFLLRAAAWAGVISMPLLILVLIVIGAKWRRRRRRLRGPPAARIRGAWTEATDQLVDAGLTIRTSMTNGEIAQAGTSLAPDAARELDRLAVLSTAATFGHPVRPDLLAADAATCLAVVERSVDEGRSWRTRVRRRLSVRSLRSATRSPV
ncbi:MAG: transglutaminase domain-containing protein, partial [Actinomycetota bacterium]